LSDDRSQLEDIASQFHKKIIDELANLDTSNDEEGLSSEQRLKSYLGFFKLLQCLEEMMKRVQIERDKKSDRGVDILEFRQQLEEQIAKLVDLKNEASLS